MTEILRELCEAVGVSGEEDAVRDLIAGHIRDHVTEMYIDPIGNLLAVKRGTGAVELRVMAAAHMDEVGMMVMGFESDGLIRFSAVGGLDARLLPSTRVLVGPDQVPGIVAMVPGHLNKNTDTVPIDRLRIDIGAATKEAAGKTAEPGARISFASTYVTLGSTARCKAFDDRAGCASLIRLVQGDPFPFDLHVAFTVQEEVGLRGAQVAAQRIRPDLAFVLETTACHDLPQDPDAPDQTTITRLGGGPAITVKDKSMISDPRLVRHLARVAKESGIPYQFRSPLHAGGTDGGAIHQTGPGVPSVVVSTPCRYLHGPHSILRLDDWDNQSRLLRAAWMALTPDVLAH